MKKLALIIISLTSLAGCIKTAAPGSTKIITPANTGKGDTVTVNDNGVTYSYNNTVNNSHFASNVSCVLVKNPYNSTIQLTANSTFVTTSSDTLITMEIYAPGPLNSIGAYRVSPLDSFGNNLEFIEFQNGLENNYEVDSVTVNVLYAAGTTIIGNYELWVTGQYYGTSKTVTGNFNFHSAQIQ